MQSRVKNKKEDESIEPKMYDVELPSGKCVQMRAMKLKDQDILTDIALAKKAMTEDVLLRGVMGVGQQEVDNMLIGDRSYGLIYLRRISKGDIYETKVKCPECLTSFFKEIDLSKLEITKLNRKLLNDNFQFEITLPITKATLVCRLLTGIEERQLAKLRSEQGDKLSSFVMMMRTVSIKGESKLKNINWFRELPIKDADYFADEYQKHDCGVKTVVDVECPHCFAASQVQIPFNMGFFFATSKKTQTKT